MKNISSGKRLVSPASQVVVVAPLVVMVAVVVVIATPRAQFQPGWTLLIFFCGHTALCSLAIRSSKGAPRLDSNFRSWTAAYGGCVLQCASPDRLILPETDDPHSPLIVSCSPPFVSCGPPEKSALHQDERVKARGRSEYSVVCVCVCLSVCASVCM